MFTASKASIAAPDLTFKKTTLATECFSEGGAMGDLNKDGKMDLIAGPDIIMIGFPGKEASWYENPGKGLDTIKIWKRHVSIPSGFDNESAMLIALVNDAKSELLFMHNEQICWAVPSPTAADSLWVVHPITPVVKGWERFTHGIGGTGLYWIGLTHSNGVVKTIPHTIDSLSGIGVEIAVGNIGNDGRPEVFVVN